MDSLVPSPRTRSWRLYWIEMESLNHSTSSCERDNDSWQTEMALPRWRVHNTGARRSTARTRLHGRVVIVREAEVVAHLVSHGGRDPRRQCTGVLSAHTTQFQLHNSVRMRTRRRTGISSKAFHHYAQPSQRDRAAPSIIWKLIPSHTTVDNDSLRENEWLGSLVVWALNMRRTRWFPAAAVSRLLGSVKVFARVNYLGISPSHTGQLSLLTNAGREMSTDQSSMMLCGWLKAE